MSENHSSDDSAADAPVVDATPEPTATGHARIDEALGRLQQLDDREITEHPDEFDAIHQVLRASLAHAGRDGDEPDIA